MLQRDLTKNLKIRNWNSPSLAFWTNCFLIYLLLLLEFPVFGYTLHPFIHTHSFWTNCFLFDQGHKMSIRIGFLKLKLYLNQKIL